MSPKNRILERMVERLYSSLATEPVLSCRPHSSRQRIDLVQVAKFGQGDAAELLAALLGGAGEVELAPSPLAASADDGAREAHEQRQAIIAKLRTIAEDARTYQQDTGAEVLHVGYPLLDLPPDPRAKGEAFTKRVLAPICFVPIELAVRTARPQAVTLTCAREGSERVIPNAALIAWIEQTTSKRLAIPDDGAGADPWAEIAALTKLVCEALGLATPALTAGTPVVATPGADEQRPSGVLSSAVLGLFPVSNQGLLRDLEALVEGTIPDGPIESFLRADKGLGAATAVARDIQRERLVSHADPCQARAVRLAGTTPGLVIHGPPGTGKSQTIANIIGDHLARGERVLFVCDKRTAIDIVEYRLAHLGLGSLCAVIHDVSRDQRDLYRSVREQLEGLVEAKIDPASATALERVDAELVRIHGELARYHAALDRRDGDALSFHTLAGEWLAISVPPAADAVPEVRAIAGVQLAELLPLEREIREVLERARTVQAATNPWIDATVLPLATYLGKPVEHWRAQLAAARTAAAALDATASDVRLAPSKLQNAIAGHDAITAQLTVLEGKKLDPELALVVKQKPAGLGELIQWIGVLVAYLAIARRWYAWFCFGRKRAARAIAAQFGLPLDADPAARLHGFLEILRARRVVEDWYATTIGPAGELDDASLAASARAHHARWTALVECQHTLEAAIGSELFAPAWATAATACARAGEPVAPRLAALEEQANSIEGILRMQKALAALPPAIARPLAALGRTGLDPDAGWAAIRRGILGGELARRIEADPVLQDIDNDRMRTLHGRHRELEMSKRQLVRDAILARWTTRQKERLLAQTGSRLNAVGAELKRRLALRGEKAMRVRQVIAAGASIEGGDPLLDLRPVWMASPETVAQIFPREALFDVVIFDEASQCRLEEALPVLTRARRVVIAGDPKQLPPTRFFESSIARSDEGDGEADDQGLFEDQQSDVEDLLGAALNLEIEQCYLDVHYRSRNADLIEFSNRNFYDARLQAIPGHPKNWATTSPLRLVRIAGIYDKRANLPEAKAVVGIVKELLARDAPPSIGIACFSLVQRDAIVEALDDAAAEDAAFASRLTTARARTGAASFEGLFVKNLENVQGDERDHIIISTTYGPDPKGKFYRRFGPLARAGGGRRLNVLVTRARSEVHLVTSIPQGEYSALPSIEAGRTPNGAWLLYSYLQYAEQLGQAYSEETAERAAAKPPGTVRERPTRTPSPLVRALATRVADEGITSDMYWGNDGFCIDLAVHHPERADDVTIGVLCDGTRYDKVDDRVEWDLFRMTVLESQGWNLLRIWSPHLVRDHQAIFAAIHKEAARELAKEKSAPVAHPPTKPAPPAEELLN